MKTAPYAYTLGMAAALALGATGLCAQQSASGSAQQNGSVVAAAKAARTQKQDKPAPKVWDNDNLPKQGGVSVVGQEAAPAAGASADQTAATQGQTPASANAPAPGGSTKDQAAGQSELDAAKKQLDTLKGDLDLLQRKDALDQQSYYGKTDFASDKAGAASLQDEKDQIDAKQQEIDDLQKKIDDLSAKLGAPAAPPASESK